MFLSSFAKSAAGDRPAQAGGARCLSAWTPERTRRAIRLYVVEGLTAAEVALVLGPPFSRAAIVSKMRRLGWLKRDHRAARAASPIVSHKPTRCSSSRTTAQLPPAWPSQPLPTLREVGPTGSPAPLASLPRGACRWPIDDPGPGCMHLTLFCGGPAAGHVYCAAHRQLAARRPT